MPAARTTRLARPVGATTVAEYLAQVPPRERRVLERLRTQIRRVAPAARESISYQIPTYRLHGPLLHFAVQPKHLALYGPSLAILRALKKELAPFEVEGRTIRFAGDHPLPAALVSRLVKACVAENEARVAKKAKPASKKGR